MIVTSAFFVIPLIIVFIKVVQKLTIGVNKSKACLVGKTAIITGGNMGIGYHTSLDLASRGCKIIIACRSHAEKAKEDVIRLTGNPNIFVKHLDLCSFTSIRKFASDINETEQRLDILINNAGIAGSEETTEDGLNVTLQTNHYGPFLLTYLLIDLLKKSVPSRIVFVSSLAGYLSSPHICRINDETNPISKCCGTKLYQMATVKILDQKFSSEGVTANALHPGIVKTDIFKKFDKGWFNTLFINAFYYITLFFMKTPEEGAQTSIHVAISEELERVSGNFFVDCMSLPLPRLSRDEEFCKKIWKLSQDCVGLRQEQKI